MHWTVQKNIKIFDSKVIFECILINSINFIRTELIVAN